MKILTRIIGVYFNLLTVIAPKLSAKQAFLLFCYPFKAKLKPHQQNFLKSGSTFKLKIQNKDVQYYSWGSGKEKVLFVHGWQSHSYRWKAYIQSFDFEKYTLYAFDAPGHGNSESKIGNIPLYEKAIETLINHTGQIHHFIGHSIGSFACASFVYHNEYPMKTYTSLAAPFDANEFIKEFNSQLKLSKRLEKNLRIYFKGFTGYHVEHYSLKTFVTKIKPKSTLIIHDLQDESTPHAGSKRLSELLKQSNVDVKLKITDGFKHNLRNQEVVEAVVSHIGEI